MRNYFIFIHEHPLMRTVEKFMQDAGYSCQVIIQSNTKSIAALIDQREISGIVVPYETPNENRMTRKQLDEYLRRRNIPLFEGECSAEEWDDPSRAYQEQERTLIVWLTEHFK